MPPFQVIQETPKPDYIGGFFSGVNNGMAFQQQLRQMQKEIMSTHMQNRFNQILLSPGDAQTKYKAIMDLPNQFKNMSLTDIPEGRMFMQNYINQQFRDPLEDEERRSRIRSNEALAGWREQGGQLKPTMPEYWLNLGKSPEEAQQLAEKSAMISTGQAPRASAQRTAAPKIVRYFDKDKKMQQAMIPSDPEQYNAAIQKIQAEGGNLDTRVLSAKGNEYEKELSHWTTQYKKTFDTWGEEIDDPDMVNLRDLSKQKIAELTKKIEAELSHTEPSQPFTAPNHDPLAYEAAPSSIVVPDATRQAEAAQTVGSTQAAPVAAPTQTPAPAGTQATEAPARDFAKESQTITPELAKKYSDTAKRKLGKYATISNIRAYARQLAKEAGYKVD